MKYVTPTYLVVVFARLLLAEPAFVAEVGGGRAAAPGRGGLILAVNGEIARGHWYV